MCELFEWMVISNISLMKGSGRAYKESKEMFETDRTQGEAEHFIDEKCRSVL